MRLLLLEGEERSLRFVSPEYLGSTVGIWNFSGRRSLPYDIAVQSSKKIILALIFMNLRCPYRSGKEVILRHFENLHRAFPIHEVPAFIGSHTAIQAAVSLDR
jgi:hypothetical protein